MASYQPKDVEERILKFWKEQDIFRLSLAARRGKPRFTFYDGPPFANGRPHYGHILAMAIKDLVTRYKTMRGFEVPRRNGWDTHGLPVEYEVEKELKIGGKRQIEDEIGIEAFNEACRHSVFRYIDTWTTTMERMGRWVDFNDMYATLENEYIESVWWVISEIHKQGLLYQDFRSSPYCPRCGTALSNFEVNQGYKENTEDPAVYIKFPLADEPKTYFLAWTTTPWTLPGNAALAVNPQETYIRVSQNGIYLYIAKQRQGVLNGEWQIEQELPGVDLIGRQYQPLYRQTDDTQAYRVVAADFVSMEDGTGIVHIAPSFGQDDFELGKVAHLPLLMTVDGAGLMTATNAPGVGQFIKDADPLIMADLQKRELLLRAETIRHTYPFCWRCDTPLYYYALPGWFVAVSNVQDRLIRHNEAIEWQPSHVKDGRFGKWLAGAKDWNISRDRFWGSPLPIWRCDQCQETEVVGSVETLRPHLAGRNTFLTVRHTEADHLIRGISDAQKDGIKLTERGQELAGEVAKQLSSQGITKIVSSPVERTREMAEILGKALNLPVTFDDRLWEIRTGVFDGRPLADYHAFFKDSVDYWSKRPDGGESRRDVRRRMLALVRELNGRFKGETILIVSHGDPLFVLESALAKLPEGDTESVRYPEPGDVRTLTVDEIDLHRPWIDQVTWPCACGGAMRRIPEVFDCWFESGSMPYAQLHYPFEHQAEFEAGFPADFIAEGIDQTRGWFYTLHVLASILRDQPAFKNVVVNGMVLARDGKKLSKRLRNYTEPNQLFDTTGVDALRFFLYSSTAIGEDYRMDDQLVAEKLRKLILPLVNVLSFLKLAETETEGSSGRATEIRHDLDRWLEARLDELIETVTTELDRYDLFHAARPIEDFVQDLSAWYVRRVRTRKTKAMVATLRLTLRTLSQLLAPFCPFVAEYLWADVRQPTDPVSVHLTDWPAPLNVLERAQIIRDMVRVRTLVEQGLAMRNELGIKVRQPLAVAFVKEGGPMERADLVELIREELNVLAVKFVSTGERAVEYDTELTPELRRAGSERELKRQIQDLRKRSALSVGDEIVLEWSTDDPILHSILERSAFTQQFPTTRFSGAGPSADLDTELKVDDGVVRVRLEKVKGIEKVRNQK